MGKMLLSLRLLTLLLIVSSIISFRLKYDSSLSRRRSSSSSSISSNKNDNWYQTLMYKNLLKTLAILPLVVSSSSIVYANDAITTNPNTIVIANTATNLLDSKDIDVYFGVGCFWHVQHEFVSAENKILGRDNDHLTSRAGYAGGIKYGKINKNSGTPDQKYANNDRQVCYHNLMGVSEYGDLGHTEVVGLTIPSSSISDFADTYFSLFVNADRPDVGDRGPEYRATIGIPGGVENPIFSKLQAKAKDNGLTLIAGKGNDKDTLGKKIVWVMDTETFPFNQAELYHQFHDGFMLNEFYPQSYNDIAKSAFDRGLIKFSGCPDTIPK